MDSEPTFLFFSEFKLNELWPYYQNHVNQENSQLHNSLKLSFTYIQILRSDLVGLSLNQTPLTFLFCLRQTWMTQLILAISL